MDHSARRSRKTEANREKKRESQDEPNVNTSNAHGAGGDHSSPVRPFQGRYTLYGGSLSREPLIPPEGLSSLRGASGLADDRSGGRLLRGRLRIALEGPSGGPSFLVPSREIDNSDIAWLTPEVPNGGNLAMRRDPSFGGFGVTLGPGYNGGEDLGRTLMSPWGLRIPDRA